MFALAACDSDSTPIVPMAAAGSGSPSAGEAVSGRDSNKLGPNDRLRITVSGQPTLSGEYTLDGNGVLAFPLIGNVPANGSTTSELQQKIAAKLNPDYLINPSVSACRAESPEEGQHPPVPSGCGPATARDLYGAESEWAGYCAIMSEGQPDGVTAVSVYWSYRNASAGR